MGLLMANQPWNLLLFMALPFAAIYLGLLPAALGLFPRWLGRAAVTFLAVYLTVASVYLVRWAIVPLTDGSEWRGPVDLIAVGGYALTAVPILPTPCTGELESGWPGWGTPPRRRAGGAEGFEPLTPCVPCHPHGLTRPAAALPSTTSVLLSRDAGRAPWGDARPREASLLTTC